MFSECDCVYTDGGLVGKNPSPHGGTWAYSINSGDRQVYCESGLVLPVDIGLSHVTNNVSELWAAMKAFEFLPAGWSGRVYTDSLITLYRIRSSKSKFKGVPADIKTRFLKSVHRLGKLHAHLVMGHPSGEDVERGWALTRANEQIIVSRWNVWCDRRCTEEAVAAPRLAPA